jgi:hypothetical protein
MSYRVILEGSNDRQILSFRNHDDALNFASMAVENGVYQDFHYEPKDGDSFSVRVDDEPRPLQVTMMGVDD